ncbi:MAG TPA: prepilin-type N-terminal cleavage/methylation domain-containing protein [Stellaceae bacterium]|nr:prepilin-type N-terminal cleavage/methylation domain-containing protein [Stellaceae bacterium]
MRPDRAAGFTLLEVVIGLAIASLALIALFEAGSEGLFAVETTGRVKEAVQRAQSHLAAIDAGGAFATGETAGNDGGGFRWRIRTRPIALQQGGEAEDAPSLFAVEIVISWRERGRTRSVALASRRLATAAGSE